MGFMEDINNKLHELLFLYNIYLLKKEDPNAGKLVLDKVSQDKYVILIKEAAGKFSELTNELNGPDMVEFIKNLIVDIHIEATTSN